MNAIAQTEVPPVTAQCGGGPDAGWTRRDWLLAGLLAAVTFGVYAPAWRGAPVFDDLDHLTSPELQSLSGLGRIWTELGAVSQYYPVTHSAFWLQHRLWGDAMLGYHLTTLALHVGCALLAMQLLRRLALPGAWFAAWVFALHPVHVESVAWISELKNTLSGACALGAALCYVSSLGRTPLAGVRSHVAASASGWSGFRPASSGGGNPKPETRNPKLYLAALALFVAGCLAKAVVATLPAALLVVLWWRKGRLEWREDIRPLAPFLGLGVAFGLFCAWVERTYIGAQGSDFALGAADRLLLVARVPWFYLRQLLWPDLLVFIYPRWSIEPNSVWLGFAGLSVAAAAALLALVRVTRGPLAVALLFVGTLVPVLGFLDVYPFVYSFVADHYQYLASVAVIGGIAALLTRLFHSRGRGLRGAGLAGAALILAALGRVTWLEAGEYVDAETLWRATLAGNPGAFVAHANLANLYLERRDSETAFRHAQAAAELQPRSAEVQVTLGNVLRAVGRSEEATQAYLRALDLRPLAPAHYNLGALALEAGDRAAAFERFNAAVRLRPDFVRAQVNLGCLLLEDGKVEQARAAFEQALRIRPDDAEAHNNLGNALVQTREPEAALRHYRRALEGMPGNYATWYNSAAALLALGQEREAIANLRRALELNPQFEPARQALVQLGVGARDAGDPKDGHQRVP